MSTTTATHYVQVGAMAWVPAIQIGRHLWTEDKRAHLAVYTSKGWGHYSREHGWRSREVITRANLHPIATLAALGPT